MMKLKFSFWTTAAIAAAAVVLFALPVRGQDDAVYRKRGLGGKTKITGKIARTTPNGVTIETSSGTVEIPGQEVDKLQFWNEPSEVDNARDRLRSGRFNDALDELKGITEPIQSPLLQTEVDYLRAAASANVALRSGTISPADAGRIVNTFVTKHGTSIHFYPATDLLGKLLFAASLPQQAEKQFAILTSAVWPEYKLKGYFYRGKMRTELGKYNEAQRAFDAIESIQSNDKLVQDYKLLARVEKAKAIALAGKPDEAVKKVEEVIKVENPDRSRLFAHAYNALGVAHLKAGRKKEAAMAFLHTDLLYPTESEAHAEALYYLAKLWSLLEKNDRASQARETLTSSYRNSFWATKLLNP